ncbi:hypothetical protein [Streptomyces sp. DH12]|uniref:hypothetical protein n=1 Tax=Streptomyces sp. DH12 TaxID=2857010 RepID=UPI001E3C6932|nr:hypothetical protein [Streptomyces sp. DH12]
MGKKQRLKRLRCGRCKVKAPRDLGSQAAADWNGKWVDGRLALVLCPDCQSPEESVEAEANAAELSVGRADGGVFVADPVVCTTGASVHDGEVLYGRDHLARIASTGRSAYLQLVSELPVGTRCVATVGGVMIYLPRKPAPGKGACPPAS